MPLFRTVALAALVLVALVGAIAAVAYAADYGLEARVVDKRCTASGVLGAPGGPGSWVRVRTKFLGIDYIATGMSASVCAAMDAGNFVVYHVRSHRTSLYESEGGACVYDTVGGAAGCP